MKFFRHVPLGGGPRECWRVSWTWDSLDELDRVAGERGLPAEPPDPAVLTWTGRRRLMGGKYHERQEMTKRATYSGRKEETGIVE